jgi:hypothetical protein
VTQVHESITARDFASRLHPAFTSKNPNDFSMAQMYGKDKDGEQDLGLSDIYLSRCPLKLLQNKLTPDSFHSFPNCPQNLQKQGPSASFVEPLAETPSMLRTAPTHYSSPKMFFTPTL